MPAMFCARPWVHNTMVAKRTVYHVWNFTNPETGLQHIRRSRAPQRPRPDHIQQSATPGLQHPVGLCMNHPR